MGDAPVWRLEERAKPPFYQLLDGASELDGLLDCACFCRKGQDRVLRKTFGSK